jgi:DNA-binding MarR family transcriptional regulator
MKPSADPDAVGEALSQAVTALSRRLRQIHQGEDGPTMPESVAMTRLEESGPATSADLARAEQITPQSMGVTLAALESRGMVRRDRDPNDGRRIIYSLTPAGTEWKATRRNHRAELIAHALGGQFTPGEINQLAEAARLLDRLASAL